MKEEAAGASRTSLFHPSSLKNKAPAIAGRHWCFWEIAGEVAPFKAARSAVRTYCAAGAGAGVAEALARQPAFFGAGATPGFG